MTANVHRRAGRRRDRPRSPWRVAGALIASGLALAGGARAQCRIEKIAELPVTMEYGHPLIPADLDRREARLIVDSGAFYSLLTPATAENLKLRQTFKYANMRMKGFNGETQVWVGTVKAFGLAGVTLPNVEFLVGGSALGGDVAGVLGQNVLGIADVEYDLAAGVLRLWKPRDCSRPIDAYWAGPTQAYGLVSIRPPEAVSRHTVGTVAVNGVKITAVFDTGAPTSILSLGAARRAGIDPRAPQATDGGLSGGIGRNLVPTVIAPVAKFEIGGETINHTRLRVGGEATDLGEMLVGADFFLSHRVYVANAQHRLLFTYNGGPVFDLSRKPAGAGAKGGEVETTASGGGPSASDADAQARLGAAAMSRNDVAGAIEAFTRARALAPGVARYAYERAIARYHLGQWDPGDADLDDALKLEPDYTEALLARASRSLHRSRTAAALADMAAADRALAKSSDMRPSLGELYQRADRFGDAILQFDAWLSTHPADFRRSVILNDRCWTRALAGQDLDRALADCNQALKMQAGAPAILDSRGLVFLRLGRNDKAIADYDAALMKRPKTAWSLFGRGLAKTRLGRAADGRADIAAAAALDPELPARAKAVGLEP